MLGAIESFRAHLEILLTVTPVESGQSHPAEEIVADFLNQYPIDGPAYLQSYLLRKENLSIADKRNIADTLILFGRMPQTLVGNLGYDIASKALQSEDVRIRDAAIGALEQLGGKSAVEILEKHHETVDWLAEYVSKIIKEMKNC